MRGEVSVMYVCGKTYFLAWFKESVFANLTSSIILHKKSVIIDQDS